MLAIRTKKVIVHRSGFIQLSLPCQIDGDVMVISADMLFHEHAFNINVVYQYFASTPGNVACYYTTRDSEPTSTRGMMVLDQGTHRVTDFYEKRSDSEY